VTPAGDDPELILPFVCVSSKGGPFDDEAFTAGFECGMLWDLLGGLRDGEVPFTDEPVLVRASLRVQADLMAMERGYTMAAEATDGGWWLLATFTRDRAVAP
jgi:hypothetical protein